jgi:hypothetical protein
VFVIATALTVLILAAVLFVPHIELKQTLEERLPQPELHEEAA